MPLLALLLVISGQLFPDGRVEREMYLAVRDGSLEADSYQIGYTGGVLDGHSECKRMSVGLGAPAGMGVVESAIRSPTLGACESAVPKLLAWADGEALTKSYEYFRYWNGSAVLLRPSVGFVGVAGSRLLAAVALAIAIVGLAAALARVAGRAAAAVALAPLVLTTDFIDLPGALLQAIGMIVALASAALILWFLRAESSPGTYASVGFAAGGAFLFFADLTNPDAAWTLAAGCAAVLAVSAARFADAAIRVAAVTVAWIAGFAWLWMTKWIVASFVYGFDGVRSAIVNQADERLNGDADGIGTSRFAGFTRAWNEWWNEPLVTVVVLGAIVAAVVIAVRRGDIAATWQRRLLIASPAVIPFVWHVVMRQHTYIHGWFTYRAFAVALGIALLGLTARLREPVPSQIEGDQAR